MQAIAARLGLSSARNTVFFTIFRGDLPDGSLWSPYHFVWLAFPQSLFHRLFERGSSAHIGGPRGDVARHGGSWALRAGRRPQNRAPVAPGARHRPLCHGASRVHAHHANRRGRHPHVIDAAKQYPREFNESGLGAVHSPGQIGSVFADQDV